MFKFFVHCKGVTIQERASVAAKAPSGDLAVNPPVISDQTRQTTSIRGEHNELERGTSANLPCGVDVVLPGTLGVDGNVTMVSNPSNDAELTKLEQAATKAQAAFRGYLVIFSISVSEYCTSVNTYFICGVRSVGSLLFVALSFVILQSIIFVCCEILFCFSQICNYFNVWVFVTWFKNIANIVYIKPIDDGIVSMRLIPNDILTVGYRLI